MTSHPNRRLDDALGMERFFELSSDLLCIVDSDGRFLRLSRSWQTRLDYDMDEMLGRQFMDFVHPDDCARTLETMARLLDGEDIEEFSNRYRTRAGEYRILSWRSTTADDNGLIFAVARDMTTQHLHAQRLQEGQARLRAIMDTIPDLVFIKDSEFRYLGCNRPFEVFMGHAESQLVGRDDFQFFAPDMAQFFRDHDIAMMNQGSARRNEEWVTYPDGRRVLLDTIKVPFRDPTGAILGLVGISRDITEQARLRNEVDFLGAMVNLSRDAVCCFDPGDQFRLLYANDAACQLFGTSRSRVLGAPLAQFDANMTEERRSSTLAMIDASSMPVVIQTEIRRPGNGTVPVELSISRIRHADRDFLVGWLRDVSMRRAVELRLLEREALYRASIEATGDGFWLVDMQGRLLDVNTAYATMSGYSVGELKSMTISDLEAQEHPEETAARIALVQANGGATFETRHRRADGSIWDVEVKTLYSHAEGGRFFVFVHDLTRKRRADSLLKARLHLSEIGRTGNIDALMTEVLDTAERLTASRIGFFHFVDSDQQTLTLQAWSTNTLARMCTAEGKGRHYRVSEAGLWADCLRHGTPMICNDYAAAPGKKGMPEGHAPITRMLAVPVRGEHGFTAVIGVGNKTEDYDQDDIGLLSELSAIAMDIVNWVRAENDRQKLTLALATTAHQWTAAMDSFQDGIALLDREHRLVRANAAFFALTASSPEHRLGRVVHCLADIDTRAAGCPTCNDIQLLHRRQFVIEAGDRGNPSGKPLEVRITPILDDTGGTSGALLSLYDLTDVRAQERQLQDTIGQLTRSRADLERFAQITAHDLQEPTRRQVLFAQLLRRRLGDGLDSDSASYVTQIVTDSLKMREMVHGLKTYFEAAQSAWPRENVDLDQVLTGVSASLAKEISHAGANLMVSPLGIVQGEPSRLHLLFANLISNSLKFRQLGRPPVITISGEADGLWLTVTVADNGQEIPEEYRDTIFTPFSRLSTTSEVSSGMGLAQCRHVVEDLGGKIWIEGNPENGTTVKFTLPR